MIDSAVNTTSARDRFLRALLDENTSAVRRCAREMLEENSSVRTWAFMTGAIRRAQSKLSLKPYRIALLSSFSTEFFHAPLIAYGLANGFDIKIYQAGLNQFRQEILNSGSELYKFNADVTIIAVEGSDYVPELYREYATHVHAGIVSRTANLQDEMSALINSFQQRSQSVLLIHNLVAPIHPEFGILDARLENGQMSTIAMLNQWLAEQCRRVPNIYMLDYASLVGRFGAIHWYDERMSSVARAPIAADMLPHLMTEYMKFFRAFTGQSKKCLVLDLDNTLWGGILGENGAEDLQLGPAYPGSAFVAFQRSILQLQRKGVLLAIASKNDAAEVDRVFEAHPHMLLKKEHFVCAQIHWNSKVESITEISKQLNIALDHIVFVDDNPVECEAVGQFLPEVHVIHLPEKPELFVDALMSDGLFDTITYSSEDGRRTELYRQREQAEAARANGVSLEDYYRSLQMRVTFAPVGNTYLQRAAQLTQKTNQFNATTRRYSEAALLQLMEDPAWLMISVRVEDRFGDNGIVGLILAHAGESILDIDTFLLSCRVIGRTIETAMLAYVFQEARSRALQEIAGHIVNSAKNAPIRDMFERHGFHRIRGTAGEESSWTLSIDRNSLTYPEWIQVEVEVASVSQRAAQ